MTIRIREIPEFTFPEELLSYEATCQSVVTEGSFFSKPYVARDLYLQTQLTKLENDQLAAFQDMCEANEIKLSRYMQARALRYIHLCAGDIGKAVMASVETMAWRSQMFSENRDYNTTMRRLAEGIAYIGGRDAEMRPVIVFRVQEAIERLSKWSHDNMVDAITFVYEFIHRYMMLPGKVEKYSILLDMTGVRPMSILGMGVADMLDVVRKHYCKRLHSVYVVGLQFGVWPIFRSVLGLSFNSKRIKFINHLDELRRYFAATQLEEKYGGIRENLTIFFPWTFVPGPFFAGYEGAPRWDSLRHIHKAISRETSIGHLWTDRKRNDILQRTELTWSLAAPPIFKELGLISDVLVSSFRDKSENGTMMTEAEGNSKACSMLSLKNMQSPSPKPASPALTPPTHIVTQNIPVTRSPFSCDSVAAEIRSIPIPEDLVIKTGLSVPSVSSQAETSASTTPDEKRDFQACALPMAPVVVRGQKSAMLRRRGAICCRGN